ncbi:hypothetical protein G6F31_021802 [Rhizopus arrhizus]|nr:hypothetical protein G6F31_021802 [Rhizopus arrhizus]
MREGACPPAAGTTAHHAASGYPPPITPGKGRHACCHDHPLAGHCPPPSLGLAAGCTTAGGAAVSRPG